VTKRRVNPGDYVIDPDKVEVSNIDLDREAFSYRGRRLTEDDAERIADETLAELRRGRPSLTGTRQHSPQVAFRLTPELRAEVEAQAAREGRRVSDVARQALEEYLARHR
jgi:hypothetical protein